MKGESQTMNKQHKWLLIGLAVGIVAVFCVLGIIAHFEFNKIAAEKERREQLMREAVDDLDGQYFPLEGEATALRFYDYKNIIVIFLNDDMFENHKHGDVKYKYNLTYISDDKYQFVATLDKLSSTVKEDYSFRCILQKCGDTYVLSNLETENPYPEFTLSQMLKGQDLEEMETRENQQFMGMLNYMLEESRKQKSSSEVDDDTTAGSSTGGSSSSSGSKSYINGNYYDEIDSSDYEIDQYYYDYDYELESEDDAWEDFLDNPEYWDDY